MDLYVDGTLSRQTRTRARCHRIDEVAVYSTALPAARVQRISLRATIRPLRMDR